MIYKLLVLLLVTAAAVFAGEDGTQDKNQDNSSNISKIYETNNEDTILIYKNEEALFYSMPITRQLDRLDKSLAKGAYNTRFYSLTNGVEIIHNIKDGNLYFITPTESELQSDFQPDVEYKYVATPRDNVSTCFKYLGWGGDPNNPVWMDEKINTTWNPYGQCFYHPFVLEGVTHSGVPFQLYYLMAMSGAPVPYNYSTNPNSFVEIALEPMPNYGVISDENPLVIKIHGDWESVSELSIRNIVKGVGTNIASKFHFDEEGKLYIIDAKNLPNSSVLLNFYGNIKFNTNNKKNKSLKDTAGYEIYAFKGGCRVEGTALVDEMPEHDLFALLECSVKNETDKSFRITQRVMVQDNGDFLFENVPSGAKCSVKVWDLDSPAKNTASKYMCE